MTKLKSLESRIRVRFSDCDPFNHLHNSRYIDYMINTREDQVREHYGLDLHQLALKQGIGWVSAQTQISYVQPAYLNEPVAIETRLLHVSAKSLLLEALMWNEDKTVLKSLMWTRLVHYDIRERKSRPHSADLMELFSGVMDPLAAPAAFEERVGQFRSPITSTI